LIELSLQSIEVLTELMISFLI